MKPSLADLLDASIRSIGSTWRTALLVGGVLFVPAAVAMGEASARMFSILALLASHGAHGGRLAATVVEMSLRLIAASALLVLVSVFVRACMTLHTCCAVNARQTAVKDVVSTVLRERLLPLVGQRLLLLAIYALVSVAAMVPATGGVLAAFALGVPELAVPVGGAVASGLLAVLLWLGVRFALALEALVIRGGSVGASLKESIRVVDGAWWAVLGRLLLIGLITGFAFSVVAAPILTLSLLSAHAQLQQPVFSESGAGAGEVAAMLRTLAGLRWQIALSVYLSGVFMGLALPGFMTLLYLDMKTWRDGVESSQAAAGPAASDASPRVEP